jgi:DNA helicase-2/ATP-dependent DNA helicase PcrA
MTTAAAMLGNEPRQETDPESLCPGMLITHPEYGLGKIIGLSGEGRRRSARVQFFSVTREMSFVLVHCQLQPVKSPDP